MSYKVVRLNANYKNNNAGEVCSFPDHEADALCAKRLDNGKSAAEHLEDHTKKSKARDAELAAIKAETEARQAAGYAQVLAPPSAGKK